jgi:chaperonin GroES
MPGSTQSPPVTRCSASCQCVEGDHVLFNADDVAEVEVRGETFVMLRERDLHAIAAERLEEGHSGLYL